MIDSHCHLDFSEFENDRGNVWQSAQKQGVDALLIPATRLAGFDGICHLCKNNPRFYYALGLHPWFLHSHSVEQLPLVTDYIEKSLRDPQFLAIGETGLDFVVDVPMDIQVNSFIHHLELAKQFSLPLIIHHRKSHNRLIQILKQFPDVRGVIHAFSGSIHEARTYVDMGFMLGIGGTITYERARKTKDAIKQVGIEFLLLETDAPAMPMQGNQGQRNSPEYLPSVVKELSILLQLESSFINSCTNQNFYNLFDRASDSSK